MYVLVVLIHMLNYLDTFGNVSLYDIEFSLLPALRVVYNQSSLHLVTFLRTYPNEMLPAKPIITLDVYKKKVV